MSSALRALIGRVPDRCQQELRRLRFEWQISHDQFRSPEPEYDAAPTWLRPGDCAIDVGANIGHYTVRFARIVGPSGRVFAFEPVSTTFSLLAANVEWAGLQNVTLVNAAVLDSTMLARMEIPNWAGETIKNLYQAHLSNSGTGALVLCLPLDSLPIPSRVALVKIDAEGFDEQVLSGMRHLLDRDKPRLIVEMGAHEVPAFVRDMGYQEKSLPGSPNVVLTHPSRS